MRFGNEEVSCEGDGPRVRVTAMPGMPACLHPVLLLAPPSLASAPLVNVLSEAREVAQ